MTITPDDSALLRKDFLRLLWIAASIATLLKLVCAAMTLGTVDIGSFFGFGKVIVRSSLEELYRNDRLFNHMPLVGMTSALLYKITGGSPRLFAFLLRLPGIAADLVTLAALLRVVPLDVKAMRWGMLLFAVSPVSFIVSGFHGNVDPIMVCFLVLAAVSCAEGELKLSAVFYALACNIKTPALLLAPVFFFFWMARGEGMTFFLLSVVTTLAGWSYPLLVCPREFLSHVLGYGSYWGTWGVTYWLWRSGWETFSRLQFENFTSGQLAVLWPLKLLIISSTIWLAWSRRSLPGRAVFHTIGAIWLVFMVLSPGMAVQYLVWPAPFLLLISPRHYAWLTAACTVHMLITYTVLSRGFPWYFAIAGNGIPLNQWLAPGNISWAAFILFACIQAKRLLMPPSDPSPVPTRAPELAVLQ